MKRFLILDTTARKIISLESYPNAQELSAFASVMYFAEDIQKWLDFAQTGDKLVLNDRMIICLNICAYTQAKDMRW